MAYLLDTHTLLWAILDDERLSEVARKIIVDIDNVCYFSIASLWEIAIKHSLGSLDIKMSLRECFDIIIKTGFTELSIKREHLIVLEELPFHHRDPFDRILISQAISEELVVLTRDKLFAEYAIRNIW